MKNLIIENIKSLLDKVIVAQQPKREAKMVLVYVRRDDNSER
ncbi:hypothetical protein ACFQZJ_12240 [Maribacter chungangensis]|uniref:Uncharacterized protein n=1 Tax=Maribacter chungangensis TaxID=1069117 RepID=A0ABW3B4J0_9FLAO